MKVEREQLQKKYDSLLRLHIRLKKRSAAEAPKLLELIREEENTLEEHHVTSPRVPCAGNDPWMEPAGK
jgi:hypothetical protein